MFKSFILLIISSIFLNASIHGITVNHSTIADVPDSEHCYSRSVATESTTYYEAENLGEYNEVSYYCEHRYKTTPSSSWIDADSCSGPSMQSQYSPVPEGGSVTLNEKSWYFTLKLCSAINTMPDWCEPVLDSNNSPMSLDSDCNPVVYVDGIPYEATTIENARYYNSYTGELVCNQSYLSISNGSCIQPDYDNRNIADAILKRDKIANDNNLTDVSGISPDNISYNEDGSIKGFSFTATGPNGLEVIYTEFNDDDPAFIVEEDGTITETDGSTGTNGSDSGTDGSTGSTGNESNDLVSLTRSMNDSIDDVANQSLIIADSLSDLKLQGNTSNQHLDNIESNISQINEALNPDLRDSNLDNPLENADTFYDESIIPEISELITNFTSDFNTLKDTYTDKINYIQENGFEFDYESQLYETCPLNFTLNPFKDYEDGNLTDEEFSLNFDICSLMANAKLPDTEITMLYIFHIIFYTFFYIVILLGIFKLAVLTFRSF